jgi:hypothetical protein
VLLSLVILTAIRVDVLLSLVSLTAIRVDVLLSLVSLTAIRVDVYSIHLVCDNVCQWFMEDQWNSTVSTANN